MSDAAIFIAVFGGLFVLRIIAATIFFFFLLPQGDRCINCDAPTLRVQRAFWHRWLPWFRPSWCMECGWKGMLRSGGPLTAPPTTAPPLPVLEDPARCHALDDPRSVGTAAWDNMRSERMSIG
jgi:hypothetical protein